MGSLDSEHTITFWLKPPVGGAFTDVTAYVLHGATITDVEGSETDTLNIELENYDGSLTVGEWSECYLLIDSVTYLFYGRVTKVKTRLAKSGAWVIFGLYCESSVTLMRLTPKVTGTWTAITVQALVTALFTAAGLSSWDTTTYVTVGPTIVSFTCVNEPLVSALDRLALIVSGSAYAAATWVWRVEQDVKLRLGASSSNAAPFGITPLATANWSTTFPASGEIDIETDAGDIVNRVTVKGGRATNQVEVTECFNGNGSQTLFKVAHMPIKVVVRITVGSTIQTRGIEGWDTHPTYNTLVSYAGGTFRFAVGSAPPVGVNNVCITYQYAETTAYDVVVTDAASYAAYGLYFDAEVADKSITSVQQATDIAGAVLTEFSAGRVEGTFTVERFGLFAGQTITLDFPLLGLAGGYVIRRVTTEFDKAGTGVKATVRFGGRLQTLGGVIGGLLGTGEGAYAEPTLPTVEGEGGIVRMKGRIEMIDPTTTYVEP